MKGIKTKILRSVISSILAVVIIICFVSSFLSYISSLFMLKQTLVPAANMASYSISNALETYFAVLTEASLTDTFINSKLDSKEVIAESESIAERNGFVMFGKTDINGNTRDGQNLSDRDYFKQCESTGTAVISELIVNKLDESLVFVFAVPIMKNNVFDGIVYGTVDADFLSNISSSLKVGETGYAYVLDADGCIIAHKDKDKVINQTNVIKLAQSDKSYKDVADFQQHMINQESGFSSYNFDGANKIVAYAPIEGSSSWSVAIIANKLEFTSTTLLSIAVTLFLSVIILIIASLITIKLANSISKPINDCVDRLTKLEDGDLESEVPETKNNDETKILLTTLKNTIDTLKDYIRDISRSMKDLENGDLSTKLKADYKGDFVHLSESITNVVNSFNDMVKQIDESANLVSNSANQFTQSSQILSQGATDQASSSEELLSTITEISDKVKNNASNAEEGNLKTQNVGNKIKQSNQQMQSMVEAMAEITKSSNEISNIVKTIEDISSQTNLLALNAAIEAARAGEAGKGFAVVADEIRNLANESAEATQNIISLIETSIKAVGDGTDIADITAQNLSSVVEDTQNVVNLVEQIANVSTEQSYSLEQVTTAIEQISNVIQNNSETAQQGAVASEELLKQAETLKNLVSRFKLN